MASLPILSSMVIIVTSYAFREQNHGLIYGLLCGHVIISIIILFSIRKDLSIGFKTTSLRRFIFFIKKNKDFTFFTMPASIIHKSAVNLPIYIIGILLTQHQVGIYSMLVKIIWAPSSVISSAVNQVIMQKITQKINAKQKIYPMIFSIIKNISFLSIFITLCAYIFFYFNGFTIVLGEQWASIDALGMIFMPAITIGFISKSISQFAVYRKNLLSLWYQMFFITIIFISMLIGNLYKSDLQTLILFLSAGLCFAYLIQLFLFLRVSREHDKSLEK